MLTREIPRNEWVSFFNKFSREYQGRDVTMEVMEKDLGDQIEANKIPLEGIAVDLKSDGRDIISIIMGDNKKAHLCHTITAPTHVHVEENKYAEALQITTMNGPTILLRFCSSHS